MKAEFWERTDSGTAKIATLVWDGKLSYWSGSKLEMVQRILAGPSGKLNGRAFDPSRHWGQLETLISGSRLWAVVS